MIQVADVVRLRGNFLRFLFAGAVTLKAAPGFAGGELTAGGASPIGALQLDENTVDFEFAGPPAGNWAISAPPPYLLAAAVDAGSGSASTRRIVGVYSNGTDTVGVSFSGGVSFDGAFLDDSFRCAGLAPLEVIGAGRGGGVRVRFAQVIAAGAAWELADDQPGWAQELVAHPDSGTVQAE